MPKWALTVIISNAQKRNLMSNDLLIYCNIIKIFYYNFYLLYTLNELR